MLYYADLHGNLSHYRQLLNVATTEKADCIVLGGDLLPNGKSFSALVDTQKNFIIDHLRVLFENFRQRNPEKRIFLIMGNDDFAINVNLLEEMSTEGLVLMLHLQRHFLTHNLSIAGYSCVSPTSFMIKDWERLDGEHAAIPARSYRACSSTRNGIAPVDAREWFMSHNTIGEDLKILATLSDPAKTVYAMHSPPFWTNLDVLWNGRHAGSHSIRHFIEENRPPLTLQGHIHESHRMTNETIDRIGDTICINTGQSDTLLHALMIEIPGFSMRRV